MDLSTVNFWWVVAGIAAAFIAGIAPGMYALVRLAWDSWQWNRKYGATHKVKARKGY